MEACVGVEREVKKVLDKFSSLTSSNAKALSETQALLRSAKNDVQVEGKLKIVNIFSKYWINFYFGFIIFAV